MSDDHDDARFYSSISIEALLVLPGPNADEVQRFSAATSVTPENITSLAIAAAAAHPEASQGAFCIISRRSEPDETFSSGEHFVPEAFGFSWTRLPPGFGTCDRINAAFSKYELQWLRFGTMGAFRPFYVSSGKKGPPEFHAPKKSNRVFSFTRNPHDGRRTLAIVSNKPLGLPEQSGSGELRFRVRMTDANSTYVSLALHKMTYLALWLAQPDMIYDPGFDPLLRFLNSPAQETFRPYRERLIPGSEPGVSFKFYVDMEEVESEPGAPRVAALRGVHAAVRVHHMLYFLSLLGEMPPDASWDGTELKSWQPPDISQEVTSELVFGIGGIRQDDN